MLSPPVRQRAILSKMTDRPKKYFVEKALESYLAEYADYQIALDRLSDKDDPVISSATMKRRLGRRLPRV